MRRGFRRETGSFTAKNQMPHPVPYSVGFELLNPPLKVLHKRVIPAQLEFSALQLCPCSGLPSTACHSPAKLSYFQCLRSCCSAIWKGLLPGLLFSTAITQFPRCSLLLSSTLAATKALQHLAQMHLAREPSLALMVLPATLTFLPLSSQLSTSSSQWC